MYVLENDADPDGDVVGILSWTTGPGIEIEQVLGFAFRVTVLADAPEQSQFTYTISDGRNEPVTGNVVVAVSDANTPDQPPVARPDTVEVRPGQTTSTRVLVNDYDPEGGALRVVNVSPVPGADLRIGPGGQEIFVSVNPGVASSFSFGYDVADEGGNRSGSLVQVRLVPDGEANRPPVARPDVARTVAGRAVDIPVLANDSDPDGDAIQLESIAAQPAFGVATTQPDGSVRYEPGPAQSGSDRLRYTIVDANGERAVGEVVIGVLPADGENRPPTATNDSYTVIAGSDVVVVDVLANDSDPDGDPLSITDRRVRVRCRPPRRCGRHPIRTAPHPDRTDRNRCRSRTASPMAGAAPIRRWRRSTSSRRRRRWRRSRRRPRRAGRRRRIRHRRRARQRLRPRRSGRRADGGRHRSRVPDPADGHRDAHRPPARRPGSATRSPTPTA